MTNPTNRVVTGMIGILLIAAASLRATPVTVEEIGMKSGAYQIVSITSSTLGGPVNVYAGVVTLKVDGTPTDGFCIDPWHWSVSHTPLAYDLRPLAQGPAWPAPMGSAAATTIEKLWGEFYTPAIDAATAAALQVEIWKIIDDAEPAASFGLVSAPAGVMGKLGLMDAWLAGDLSNAPASYLSAVVSVSYGAGKCPAKISQDYLIPGVPDGSWTVVLVGIGMLGLCLVRRRTGRA